MDFVSIVVSLIEDEIYIIKHFLNLMLLIDLIVFVTIFEQNH